MSKVKDVATFWITFCLGKENLTCTTFGENLRSFIRIYSDFYLMFCDLLQVFSFKLRGAYNMMAKLPKEQLDNGVICSSAGNHAQGVALAAKKLGCSAVIAMPVTTPEIKVGFCLVLRMWLL